jgi:plastocyanin
MRRGVIAGVVVAQLAALTWGGWLMAAPGDVEVRLFLFRPAAIEVTAGSAVTWVNEDEIRHTVTSGVPDGRDGKFDETLGGKGTRATVTFDRPGVYRYFCSRHQAMRGEVRVR